MSTAPLTSTAAQPANSPQFWTLADMLHRVPALPQDRICMVPLPGTATEDDALHAKERIGFICELIDGTLVRKTMGNFESALAAEIIILLGMFLEKNKLGKLTGPDGGARLRPEQIRYPDVAFYTWDRLRVSPFQRGTAVGPPPDLAIEVLSPSNTHVEMERKLHDYFAAGVRLVWYIDPQHRTARAFTAPLAGTDIASDGSLQGGDVLPGFELNLAELFARVEAMQ
jgi:Uma2 family endonuclease